MSVCGVFASEDVTAALPALLQIGGIDRDLEDRYSPGTVLVRVDLGRAEGRPVPKHETLQKVTVIGTSGISPAVLHDVRRICDYLCGDELEECHYEARVSLARPIEEIGTPLAAMTGHHDMDGFAPFEAASPKGDDGDEGDDADDSAEGSSRVPRRQPLPENAGWLDREMSRPVWPDRTDAGAWYRLSKPEKTDRGLGALRLAYRWGQGETYDVTDGPCTVVQIEDLDAVSCSSFAFIANRERPLLVSFADYNTSSADVVASFDYGGETYHVVRLGLKAQTVIGLLWKSGDGWQALFQPRDYALLC